MLVLSLIILFSSLVLVAGLASELSTGDEVYHYRYAKSIYQTGCRPVVDSLYEPDNPLAIPLNSEILWPFLLAQFWRIGGGVSFVITQIYQTVFYLGLLLLTYLLAKDLYSEKEGLYSVLIVAAVPMVAAFGVLFYLDVPAATLFLLCAYLHQKQRYCLAGATFGIVFLTKRLPVFFVPGLILSAFLNSGKIKQKLRNAVFFLIPALLIMLPDFCWREQEFNKVNTVISGTERDASTLGNVVRLAMKAPGLKNIFSKVTKSENSSDMSSRVAIFHSPISSYYDSFLLNPRDFCRYVGIVLPLLVIMYFVTGKYEKKDLYSWMLIISYMVGYLWIFGISDTRYILAAIPLLAILASKVFVSLNKKVQVLLILFLFLQFGSALFYVQQRRHLSCGIKEGFGYIRDNVPEDAVVMYPEYTLLEYANRKMGWNRLLNFQSILWPQDETELQANIVLNRMDWIAVKKTRIYDDMKIQHYGGYPKSFAERIRQSDFFDVVFENDDMFICKTNGH